MPISSDAMKRAGERAESADDDDDEHDRADRLPPCVGCGEQHEAADHAGQARQRRCRAPNTSMKTRGTSWPSASTISRMRERRLDDEADARAREQQPEDQRTSASDISHHEGRCTAGNCVPNSVKSGEVDDAPARGSSTAIAAPDQLTSSRSR